MEKTEYKSQFIQYIINLIIKLPQSPPICYSALIFFRKFGPQMKNYSEFSEPILSYILNSMQKIPDSKKLGCDAILSIFTNSPQIITFPQLGLIHTFLQNNYLQFEFNDSASLSKAIASCIIIMEKEKLPEIIKETLKWIINEIKIYKLTGNDQYDLRKIYGILNILYGYINVLEKSELSLDILNSLSDSAKQIWEQLCNLLLKFGSVAEFSELSIKLIKSFFATCGNSLVFFNIFIKKSGIYFENLAKTIWNLYENSLKFSGFLSILSFSTSCINNKQSNGIFTNNL